MFINSLSNKNRKTLAFIATSLQGLDNILVCLDGLALLGGGLGLIRLRMLHGHHFGTRFGRHDCVVFVV